MTHEDQAKANVNIDKLAELMFGISVTKAQEKKICVDCKTSVGDTNSMHDDDRAEYELSGLCGACFDKLALEAEAEED